VFEIGKSSKIVGLLKRETEEEGKESYLGIHMNLLEDFTNVLVPSSSYLVFLTWNHQGSQIVSLSPRPIRMGF
jgi:hypothetical protein